jgi:hypothetical protein
VAKWGRSWLEIDRRGRRSSKGGGLRHPDSRLNRIDRILIPLRYTSFREARLQRTPELSVLDPEQF